MRLKRREFLASGAAIGALGSSIGPWVSSAGAQTAAQAATGWSGGGVRSLGESLLGEPKYADDFKHFDYVNPDAPKGGVARLSAPQGFDTFNPYNIKGSAARGLALVVETLMTSSLDEGSTHYGLLAEWMERAPDDSWVAFRLRDGALWADGRPVVADDVIKSFRLLTEQGRPLYKFYYQNVTDVVDEGDRIVRFRFDETGNRELPHIMGQLTVFPSHWWASRDFTDATLERPLGSGPYEIGDFEAGRYVEYVRRDDYWGAELPVNVGANNFDRVRFEYFLDRDIEFEAFKAGTIEYFEENSASRWAQKYAFPALSRGEVVKEEPVLYGPKGVQYFAMNQRKPLFQDRRVREAIGLAFDAEWTMKTLFFGQYARPASYFQGTPGLMATAAPDAAELALLEPFRDQLPERLFSEAFVQSQTDGSGRARRQLRSATRLLREAGFSVEGRTLKTPEGADARLEFLIASKAQERVVRPFLKNLDQLGFQTQLRVVDQAQYVKRFRSYDFDMVIGGLRNSESPGNEQREYWGSAAADREGGRNISGVKNPVVDALIEKIIFSEDRAALETASRALDRVLLWEHYAVLQLYTPFERIAYWDKFGKPEPLPSRDVGFPTVWWEDAEKAARLSR